MSVIPAYNGTVTKTIGNLQATKLLIVTSATKGVVTTPLHLALGSRYCIV